MTQLLLRIFVKNSADGKDPRVRSAVGTLSGAVGIVCNLLLCLFKLIAGLLTGAVSIVADAMNNLSDASGAIVTLIGFRLSAMPADEEHPYGHARFEYLSGLAVAVMIMLIGLELTQSSVEKLLDPAPVTLTLAAGGILVLSIAVKLWLFLFNRKLSGLIGSGALMATAQDSRNDCVATGAVLLAAVLERLLGLPLDGIMGLAVALFILRSGWAMAKDTISPLLGESASEELRDQIVDYIADQPMVLGYHDLMVHDYGPGQRFASLHVEMDSREDPLVCHERIDDMERECLRSHNIHLVIHYDPVVMDDPELSELRGRVAAWFAGQDSRMTIHDFRMVRGRENTNLIFDVALPAHLRGRGRELQQALSRELNAGSAVTYHLVITFDEAAFNV